MDLDGLILLTRHGAVTNGGAVALLVVVGLCGGVVYLLGGVVGLLGVKLVAVLPILALVLEARLALVDSHYCLALL